MEMLPFVLLLPVAGLGALLRGGRVERRGALMFTLAWLASLVFQRQGVNGPWLFVLDLSVMIGLIALSWKSPRPWPVYACGFQLLVLATRIAGWTDPSIDAGVLLILLTAFGSGAIFMLTLNAWARPDVSRK